MEDAIGKCRELGFEDHDIIVDSIMCTADKYVIEEWDREMLHYKTAYEMR